MGKGSKTLCKWGKDEIKDDLEKLKTLVLPPAFICRKCGRVANSEELLCKPVPL